MIVAGIVMASELTSGSDQAAVVEEHVVVVRQRQAAGG